MSISIEAVSHLIGQIYDSAYSQESLSAVMANLARLFGGSRACLLRMGADEESFQAMASADDVGDFLRLGVDTLRNDRLLRAMQAIPMGCIVSRAQLVDEPAFRRGQVWEAFFRPREMDLGWTCKLRSSGQVSWFVDLQRSERQGPLADAELRLFQELIPHFERATRISEQLDDATGIADRLSQLSLGMLLVDVHGRILRMNSAAGALIERSGGQIRVAGNAIACADPRDNQKLRQFVVDCCGREGDGLPGTGGSMIVASGSPAPLSSLLILSVAPYQGAQPFELGSVRRAIILVHEALSPNAADLDAQVRTLFGLTIAETKIAISLASGLTLKEAADKSAIRINTARWYLDEIFRKTNTNHQGQLVALLVNLQLSRPK